MNRKIYKEREATFIEVVQYNQQKQGRVQTIHLQLDVETA